jgi:hypothetical protein
MEGGARKNLGRIVGNPRTALIVGTGPLVAAARERAGLVYEGSAKLADGVSLEAIVADAHENGSHDWQSITGFVELLADGGRILVAGSAAARRAARNALSSDARLELLCVEATEGVLSFRKRPAGGKLTVTVGMISMNEAGAVGKVIDDIQAHAPEAEILLVDSSKDETPDIARAKGARVVRQFPPRGYGPAMHRLLYEATTDVIITMDCDGTYPTDRLLYLHGLIESGADLVNATRTRHRPKAMPLANFIANRVFAGTARALHGLRTTDVHSGMRAYRTSMLRGIEVDPAGPALPVELIVLPARLGYRIVEVEIPYFERVGTTTLHRFDSTMWTFRRLLRARMGARVRRERYALE